MIVNMKKVYLLVQGKDAVPAVTALGDLGTVHVEHSKAPSGFQVSLLKEDVRLLEKIIGVLPDSDSEESLSDQKWQKKAKEVIRLHEQTGTLSEAIAKRQVQISAHEPWGDFDPEDIKQLKEKGMYFQLCSVPAKSSQKTPEGVILKEVSKAKEFSRCLAISRKEIDLPFEVCALPPARLTELKSQQNRDKEALEDIKQQIEDTGRFKKSFTKFLEEKSSALRFQEALSGMEESGEITYLKGFCPENQCANLKKKAKENRWGIFIQDPGADDHVPTLLDNPKMVELSKPALDMVEILPGYGEVDVSSIFLIFFALFFGILIGDAAYGVIFALGTFIAQWKLKNKIKDKTPFRLMYLLTLFAVIWGVATGTYFGQQWLPSVVKPVFPWLNDSQNIQWLCFTIALVHLNIARIWRMLIKLPDITALAEVGWIFIIWGMYFLANMLVLGQAFPDFGKLFFVVGIPLALFFMCPFKEFFRKVPQEIIPFLLSIVGAGTDIVSYIRLYAVGLATVAVADAANSMPEILPVAVGYFFLVFLHLLNMILAAMAILVHDIRLNVLEFSGHLSLEWSGFKYNPLKKVLKQA